MSGLSAARAEYLAWIEMQFTTRSGPFTFIRGRWAWCACDEGARHRCCATTCKRQSMQNHLMVVYGLILSRCRFKLISAIYSVNEIRQTACLLALLIKGINYAQIHDHRPRWSIFRHFYFCNLPFRPTFTYYATFSKVCSDFLCPSHSESCPI